MRKLSDTINRLAGFRAITSHRTAAHGVDRLSELPEFGSNPGALRARVYVPAGLPEAAPLVVVLHGCTQTAAEYDHGSGWSRLADRYGFALLFPEQQRANNANLCFNWFVPGDIRRGSGEALSIRQMVARFVAEHGIDSRRVFITGLSAGGAMTSAMLATYPDVFAGGAIIAGLPFGSAVTIPEAFDRMRGHGGLSERRLQALVRNASEHAGPWPTVSIWQGGGDRTVDASNAEAIIGQWRDVHGVNERPGRTDIVNGYPREVWLGPDGREVIEAYRIPGMGHGAPLDTSGADGYGASGPYMLDVGISSTLHIARFWGLAVSDGKPDHALKAATSPAMPDAKKLVKTFDLSSEARERSKPSSAPAGAGAVIENALRAAGLMR